MPNFTITATDASGQTASASGTITTTPVGGTPQLPALLNGYVVRPPAGTVAGVDYYVGLPSGTLKNPATAALPQFCTRNVGSKFFEVRGNATVEGFDFAGWNVLIYAGIPTIRGNSFVRGFLTWRYEGTSTGGTVTDNLFDQQNANDSTCLVITYKPGAYLFERNEWRNSRHMHFQIALQPGNTSLIFRNNLLRNCGMGAAQGAHGDFLQIFGGATITNIEIDGNTVVQDIQSAATQGWSINRFDPIIQKGKTVRNTMVIKAPTNYVHLFNSTRQFNEYFIQDNFADMSSVTGSWLVTAIDNEGQGSFAGKITQSGNRNMKTGGVLT